MTEPIQVHLVRAAAPDVPAGEAWLTPTEAGVVTSLHVPQRASDWRLGRWAAKRAVAAALALEHLPPERIEVLAAPGGAPVARIPSEPWKGPVSLSLSHSGGVAFATAAAADLELGCDVETIETRSDAFVADYFTEAERTWIRGGGSLRHVRANLMWSAKESALKALREGLRLDTRTVQVRVQSGPWAGPDPSTWQHLVVGVPGGRAFEGFWRIQDGRVWTLVAAERIALAGVCAEPIAGRSLLD